MRHVRFLLPIVFVVSVISSVVVADSERKLQVAVIVPLSGEGASFGAAARNGVQLGLEKLLPTVRDRLEVRFEDDRLDPKQTLAAYRRLRSIGQADVVVTGFSGTSKALAPVAEKDRTPLIAVASDPSVVAGRNWVVNFWVTPETEVELAIQEAVKRGYKRIARISTTQEGSLALKQKFDELNAGRLAVVLDDSYPQDIKDFRLYLTKLRQINNVDAVLIIMMPGHVGIFAKQVREMGIKLPLFSIECFEDLVEVRASGGALIGQWYVNADDADGLFMKEYTARFPNDTHWGAANLHDITLLLGVAVEESIDTSHINKFLHTVTDFDGALGTYSASGDNRFTLPAAVKIVRKDSFERISQ